MANKTLNARITVKRDTKSNWTTKDPVLMLGEIGVEFETTGSGASTRTITRMKVGDGTTAWSSLNYLEGQEIVIPTPDGKTIVNSNDVWGLKNFPSEGQGEGYIPYKSSNENIQWKGISSFGFGTAAWLDVPTTGDAGSSQVVKGDDTRLQAESHLSDHIADTNNPHSVTASQVGLGNVGNFKAVSTVANQDLTSTEKSNARTNIGAGTSSFSGSYNDLTNKPTLGTAAAKNVPLSGDAASTEVVMGNDSRLTDARNAADVSAWAKAANKPSYTASEVGAISSSLKGAADGVAELDENGHVKTSQLPSYVDDVLEYNSQSAFPATGEAGKIYVAKDTNKTYRWSGSDYVEISASLALGNTSSTAFWGDKGQTAYDHSQAAHAPSNAEANVLESVKVNGTALTITNKAVNIPIAGASTLGVVKSASSTNNVTVGSDGVMTVASLSTDKLSQGTDTLVFDCGTATV